MKRFVEGLIAVHLLVTLSACGQPPAGPPPGGPANVMVALVEEREIRQVFEDVGRTEAVSEVSVRARVAGVLEVIGFTEGAAIAKGDVLYQLEKEPFEVAVAEAEAAVSSAQASANKAAQYLARLQNLSDGAVSAVDMETAVADAASATASLKQAEASLQTAMLDLSYTEISAPLAGRIGSSAVDVGDLISTDGDALATIIALDPIRVTWSISERFVTDFKLARLNAGAGDIDDANAEASVELKLSNGTAYPHVGRIVFIDSKVNENTGAVDLRAEFPNPDELLIPGQFVTAIVSPNVAAPQLVIPQSAVQEDQAGRYVLIVGADNQVEQRRVELGSRTGADWVVNDGLKKGEQVIFQGIEKIRPGVEIKPNIAKPSVPTPQSDEPASPSGQ